MCWDLSTILVLVVVDYLGALVNDFKHNGWKYIPTAKLDFTQTVESDAIKYWDVPVLKQRLLEIDRVPTWYVK